MLTNVYGNILTWLGSGFHPMKLTTLNVAGTPPESLAYISGGKGVNTVLACGHFLIFFRKLQFK